MAIGEVLELSLSDGASVGGPTLTHIKTAAYPVFASDAAYVTAKGAVAAEGDTYYSSTTDKAREYNGSAWVDIDTQSSVALSVYANDAAFVTAKGSAAAEGDTYWNSTNDVQRSYTGAAWVNTNDVDQSYELANLTLTATVSSNALTVALKTQAGSDPSETSPVRIGFRSSTLATGTYSQSTATSARSVVVSSGSTLGHASG